ncbi:type II CRISPR RNA-guided endonuclease Cas9 [Phocaeicola plebeius]|uniref:type II CRISPR RNA-guided endonuclease Cas9 n=1 Tax=Phocaeicola plebeius TaxID=310297 RepID=UPI0026E937ED|nr:type II CRISPR RNA-guided endonuclease Cas9 [Phocaeicola plebeius]
MTKILAFDLGSSSIGYSLRDTDNNGENIIDQLVLYGSIIFSPGMADNGVSRAAERTSHRSSRHLYRVRRYRIWETLATLIEFGCCPLSKEDLDKWRTYDKNNRPTRQYPVDAVEFEKWIRMNPYELREKLATDQLDFTKEENRFMLGRALYHIAQRRGFRSSKGETLKEQEKDINENPAEEIRIDSDLLKKSEEKKSKKLVAYMEEHSLPTVGKAFANLINDKIRVRASEYQAVRSQYRDEIEYIFNFQKGLDANGEFFRRIYSTGNDGTIFYQNPIRSQKGQVGKCTLEPAKTRCPISHPEYEKYRAFSFINNIKYRKSIDEDWQTLTASQKIKLYKEKFLLVNDFEFDVIRKWIEKEIGLPKDISLSKEHGTINYDDRTNVSVCSVSGRLKSVFGDNWEDYVYQTAKTRKDKEGKEHTVTYTIEDIWHVCFSYDDEDTVVGFAKSIGLDAAQEKKFLNLWMNIPQGYAMLSLKAIRNINRFLVPKENNPSYKGYIYTEATLFAKIPDILGEKQWQESESDILRSLNGLMNDVRDENCILKIVNNLISDYKALDYREHFAVNDRSYKLDDSDRKDVEMHTVSFFGKSVWEKKPEDEREEILGKVEELYQNFFSSSKRDYYNLPKLGDRIKLYLSNKFPELRCCNEDADSRSQCNCHACKKLNQLYHPSMVEFYRPVVCNGKKLLGSPVTGSFRNPMAMKVLHQLHRLANGLIQKGLIDENTRIVVETARELNDANMRWAIEEYDNIREKENKAIIKAIKEIRKDDSEVGDSILEKARLLIEQSPDYLFDYMDDENMIDKRGTVKKKNSGLIYEKGVTKYRLWLEQGMQCLYTGKIINLSDLFDENMTDIEHTIPQSRSFDNSMANKTVCFAYYNREIKKNRMPTELEDYEEIKKRLLPWEKRVEQLKNRVEFWKKKARQALTKENKDKAIRQKHLWQMELDYWKDKLSRFTMTEVSEGFKHRQLNDTRLITKYAYHYLKSVFGKVDVQKGIITSEFRKIFGFPVKTRDNHSHHTIDATILTLIPVASRRDEMLRLFYEIQENKKLNIDTKEKEKQLEGLIKSCRIGKTVGITKHIENNILVKYVSKDRALTPAIRNKRVGGKVVWERNEKGEILIDINGKKIPKYKLTGDCIRGELHKASFYGAIRQSKRETEKKKEQEEDASYETSYNDISYVIRRKLSDFKDLNELHKVIVDEHLFNIIKKQCEGKDFKDVCNEGFYMPNCNNQIRHIRCYTYDVKNPLHIRKQTYLSKKDYKQTFHVKVGDLYAMCRYHNVNKKMRYGIVKLFDISKSRKKGYEIPEILDDEYYLDAILRPGMQVILYKDQSDYDNLLRKPLNIKLLSERLYIIERFEGDNIINLKKHLCSSSFKETGRGKAINLKSFDNGLPEKIRQSIRQLNYLLESVDFKINLEGKIVFRNKN